MPLARAFAALVLVGSVSLALPASAQVQRGGGNPNAQLYQEYQQAVADRTQLQADNAKLKKDLEELKKQLALAKQQAASTVSGAHRSDAALAAAQAANEASTRSLDDLKGKMQELISRFRDTIGQLQGVETERTQLRAQLNESQSAFDKCAESNYALYKVDAEVLDRYAHQGPFSYLARAEPFTQLKRTQIDNLVLEYRQRAEELRMKKGTSPGSVAAPAPAAPPSTPPHN
jgi:hypothetical protein